MNDPSPKSANPKVLFSIITPTFNPGPKLAATIASVFSQNPDLYEFLVIDGNSTDGTVERLAGHAPRLRWLSEPDRGIYDAMNKGIQRASGRFLHFLGAGDCLRPGVLQAVADALPDAAGHLRFVYGDVNWPAFGGRYGGVFSHSRLVRQNISHQAIFYEQDIFDLLGLYDLRYSTCADYVLNIRCFGTPAISKTHLDLVVADYEGGGVSMDIDRAFVVHSTFLFWRNLGLIPGLAAFYQTALHASRWSDYHFRRMIGTLLKRRWRSPLTPP